MTYKYLGPRRIDMMNLAYAPIDGELYGWMLLALSRQPRFSGATIRPYSLLDHSYVGANVLLRADKISTAWAFLNYALHTVITGVPSPYIVELFPEAQKNCQKVQQWINGQLHCLRNQSTRSSLDSLEIMLTQRETTMLIAAPPTAPHSFVRETAVERSELMALLYACVPRPREIDLEVVHNVLEQGGMA